MDTWQYTPLTLDTLNDEIPFSIRLWTRWTGCVRGTWPTLCKTLLPHTVETWVIRATRQAYRTPGTGNIAQQQEPKHHIETTITCVTTAEKLHATHAGSMFNCREQGTEWNVDLRSNTRAKLHMNSIGSRHSLILQHKSYMTLQLIVWGFITLSQWVIKKNPQEQVITSTISF